MRDLMPRTPPPRAALIGISGYGKIYLERLLHHAARGELEIAAATVINRSEEPAACSVLEAKGAVLYSDYRKMFEAQAGRLDLALIPTGIHWHTRMTLAALAAGANVLVEKPLAPTIQEVRAVQAAANAADRFVAVGFQDIYLEDNLTVKRRLVEGALGRLRRIKGRGLWPRDDAYYARNEWAGRIRVGGEWVLDSPLANALAHFLNLALFLAGDTVERSAQSLAVAAELYRARSIENFDTAAIRGAPRSGVEICFYATHSCATVLEPELHLEGTEGTAIWSVTDGWRLRSARGGDLTFPARGETQARQEMFARVLRRLRDPGTFVCGPDIAAEHTLCVNGAQAAAVIRDVPPFFIAMQRVGAAVSTQPVIADIGREIDRAFATGSLLHEAGCSWASPAGEISLESFANFSHPAA
jgi:predicted dehydrogenase